MIYGNTFLKEEYGYITEGTIRDFFKSQKLPAELKMDVADIKSAAKFKSKTAKILKWYQDNDMSEKGIAKNVFMWYFAIVGTEFSEGIDRKEKYEPKMQYYITLCSKYCNEKQKARIKKDMEDTIDAIDRRDSKDQTALQKAWKADIKSVVNKL